MICPQCDAELPDDAVFCTSCGAQTTLSDQDTVAMAATPQEEETVMMAAEPAQEAESKDDPLLESTRKALGGDYEVKRELGRGGMAVVYEGVEIELHRRVAIKVLPPEMSSAQTAERFKREARLAASLDHPHIIPVYRVGTADGIQYMAMKFVEGRAVDAIIEEQGALAIPVILKLLTDSARGLAYAHEKGVIHRDIKGGNILIDTDGRVMVADFGIARAVGDQTITATGMVVGTPNYMSPEQCGGQTLGPQADQYSLGVLAFQMITGSLPFHADSVIGIIQHHYMTPPPNIREARKGVPEELVNIVNRMLQKKAENRFPSTHDLADALEAVPQTEEEKREANRLLRELSTGGEVEKIETVKLAAPTPPSGQIFAGPERKKSKAPILVAAALGVAAIGGGLAWQQGLLGGAPEPVTQPAQPVEVILSFGDLPQGAEVQVDGRTFPGGSGTVTPGQHEVVITAPGYQRFVDSVSVGENDMMVPGIARQMTEIPREPTARPTRPQPTVTGQLLIRAIPPSATIMLDGSTRIPNGESTDVPVGRHTVRVSAPGYQAFDTTVTVSQRNPIRLPVRLNQTQQ